MLASRLTTITSLLAAAMSVYVCLLAADAVALAQKSSTVAAVQSQPRKSTSHKLTAQISAQTERPLKKISYSSAGLSTVDERVAARTAQAPELLRALLSKYLSLS